MAKEKKQVFGAALAAQYPRFELIVDGAKRLLTLREAGVQWDSGFQKVEMGDRVLTGPNTERVLTLRDKRDIQ